MPPGLASVIAAGLLCASVAQEVGISPHEFPILVSGGFLAKTAERLESPLMARPVVLDAVKEEAARQTGIAPGRMLIAATHTHSAPPSMGALGTDADPRYAGWVRERLVEVLRRAPARLEPARLGWTSIAAPEYTHAGSCARTRCAGTSRASCSSVR